MVFSICPSAGWTRRNQLTAMMNVQAQNDGLRAYTLCQITGTHFHFTAIPQAFPNNSKQLFDPDYMKALFDAGFQPGCNGIPWQETLAWLEDLKSRKSKP